VQLLQRQQPLSLAGPRAAGALGFPEMLWLGRARYVRYVRAGARSSAVASNRLAVVRGRRLCRRHRL